jgi:hypothetical protein
MGMEWKRGREIMKEMGKYKYKQEMKAAKWNESKEKK